MNHIYEIEWSVVIEGGAEDKREVELTYVFAERGWMYHERQLY